ncbi:SDR family oxidoreductase [Kibdelosporangium philippinense]|uniref:3-dehydrosphinganine reductase n=1 Tax=Kibdelosporangium philippinense TaxID=211113 RepID=A0ABS8Z7U6_9PSEU|nr:SDR family oxidoreductase [Kibdelosporangium philippinense]MCE7003953.1 SDR family oxidoreductase [Kibdelosporangium philippinense]
MHAVITGGSSGIGLAVATALGERGDIVSLIARDPDRLAKAADSLRLQGIDVRVAAVDVADQQAVTEAIAKLTTEAGHCDILVSAAGQARPGYFHELDDEVFRRMMEVDYFGTLHAIRAVTPAMIERRSGSIVAISSATAVLGIFGYTAYSPAKFAVRGLMESLRDELRPHDVHVACVYPPDVDTPQLAEENRFKPAETAAISGSVRPITAETVALAIVRAIDRKQYAVYPDRSSALLAALGPLMAPVLRRMIDRRVMRATRP